MVGLLWAMGVRAEPSLVRTLPGACGLSSLLDEVQTSLVVCTVFIGCAHSLVDVHTPQLVPVVSVTS